LYTFRIGFAYETFCFDGVLVLKNNKIKNPGTIELPVRDCSNINSLEYAVSLGRKK
jgi:hypothetical protein